MTKDVYAIGPMTIRSMTVYNEEPMHLDIYATLNGSLVQITSGLLLGIAHSSTSINFGFYLKEGEELYGRGYAQRGGGPVDYSVHVYSNSASIAYSARFSEADRFPSAEDLADIFGDESTIHLLGK